MKEYLLSILAASTLLGVTVAQSRNGGLALHKPSTVSSIRTAAFLDRASKAVTAYVNACADGDSSRLQAALADDGSVELAFAEPGTFFLVDNANAADYCNTGGASGHFSSLRMYPAGEHALFASYKQGGDKPHLVLIEMRGSRISRLRDFTADSEQVKRYAAGQQHNKFKEPS